MATSAFKNKTKGYMEVAVGLLVLFSVVVALMPTLHQTIAWFIGNLTGIGLSGAGAIASVFETVLYIMLVAGILYLIYDEFVK
jgi:hypothetical protein